MSETIKKQDLVQNLADSCGITKKDATTYVNTIFEQIANTLEEEGCVDIFGFGKFTVSQRAARTGINPLTKEKIEIAASKSVKFKAAKSLKDSIQ